MSNSTSEVFDLKPKNDTKNMELFKAIHRSQHVQRNFDLSKQLPDQDISTIVTAATQSPSKQNVAFFKVHAITNRDVIEEIYEITTCDPNSAPEASGSKYGRKFHGTSVVDRFKDSSDAMIRAAYPDRPNPKGKGPGSYPENPQVLGNLVLVFEEYENFTKHWWLRDSLPKNKAADNNNPQTFVSGVERLRPILLSDDPSSKLAKLPAEKKREASLIIKMLAKQGVDVYDKDSLNAYIKHNRDILTKDRNQALGIAVGYVNLTSSQLGYGTGCCNCIMDHPRLRKLLGMKKNAMIIMGIGFKQEGKNRRVHQLKDSYMFETRKKQPIEVSYIN